MASLNKISLIGNVGRDPESREFQSAKVASFSLAVSEKYTKSNGEVVEKTDWFRISFWGPTADTVMKYVKKGSQVYVDGRLSTSEYTDKEGKNRTALEVRGQTLTLLGSATNQGNGTTTSSSTDNTPTIKESEPSTPNTTEDDLPF